MICFVGAALAICFGLGAADALLAFIFGTAAAAFTVSEGFWLWWNALIRHIATASGLGLEIWFNYLNQEIVIDLVQEIP